MKSLKLRLTNSLQSPIGIIVLALFIFFLHISFLYHLSDTNGLYSGRGMWVVVPDFEAKVKAPHSLKTFYHKLTGWDGQWLFHIAKNGYLCPTLPTDPEGNNPNLCNTNSFPFTPKLATLMELFKIPAVYGLSLISQALYIGTLILLLLLLKKKKQFNFLSFFPVLLFTAYPSALYLLTPYVESVYIFFMVLIFYLTDEYLNSQKQHTLLLLIFLGILSCLTKANGFFILGIPFFAGFFHGWNHDKNFFNPISIKLYMAAFLGLIGLGAFLLYCQIKFGMWNIYFVYVSTNWSSHRGTELLTSPLVIFTSFKWHKYSILRMANVFMLLYIPVLLFFGYLLYRIKKESRPIFLSLFTVFTVIYYVIAACYHTEQSLHEGFLRHSLLLYMPFCLTLMLFPKQNILKKPFLSYGLYFILFLTLGTFLFLQSMAINKFMLGLWTS